MHLFGSSFFLHLFTFFLCFSARDFSQCVQIFFALYTHICLPTCLFLLSFLSLPFNSKVIDWCMFWAGLIELWHRREDQDIKVTHPPIVTSSIQASIRERETQLCIQIWRQHNQVSNLVSSSYIAVITKKRVAQIPCPICWYKLGATSNKISLKAYLWKPLNRARSH